MDDKTFSERLDLICEGSWWKRIDDDAVGTILEIRDDNSNNLIVRWTHSSFEGTRAGEYDRYEFARKWVPIDPIRTIKAEDDEETKRLKSKYHKIAKELRDLAKECDITVGSIWKEVKGCDPEDVGSLVKVIAIFGDIIKWIRIGYDVKEKGSTGSTCRSSFLYSFEKVQDNDNGAIYQSFDRVHDAKENPGKYQMIKVVETNVSTTDQGSEYGTIKYITTPVSSSVYSVNLEEFHSDFELVSLNPAEEFCEDINDPNHSRKRIDPNKGESKMEDNETYLKTDKDKLEDFGTGAKREDKSGKGRYDLIPGDVMRDFEDFCWAYYFSEGPTTCSATDVSKSAYFDDWSDVDSYYDFILNMISYFFVSSCDKEECEDDLGEVSYSITWDGFRKGIYEMRKALAKHYEAGAVVHGVDNWKKGLPIYGSKRGGCFLDSMRRHADQALMGKTDEPHAVAAIWNAVGAIWTLLNIKTEENVPKLFKETSDAIEEVKPGKRNDQVDSLLSPYGFGARNGKWLSFDGNNKIVEETKTTIPSSDEEFKITKWPEGFNLEPDFEKKAIETINYPSYNDFIKAIREANEKEKFDIMHQWCYARYNLYKCIELLRSIVKNDKFSKLDSRVTTVYFNIYMIFKTIDRIFVLFQEDSEAIKQILKIISDFHIMINLNVGHIGRCCGNIRLNWEKYSPEYLRAFECAGNAPDEDEINILYEMIGRTGSVLLRSDEKEKLDYFCGLGITQSLLEFNTKFLKDKVYNNKK